MLPSYDPRDLRERFAGRRFATNDMPAKLDELAAIYPESGMVRHWQERARDLPWLTCAEIEAHLEDNAARMAAE